MDRCALFVDASYLLADGAMAVHGTRHREAVSWDYSGLLDLLNDLVTESTGLPLLRCYWYEATVEGRRTPEHEALADLVGLKLRLGRVRPGRREGVDSQVYRDLTTLAQSGNICDAVLVTGDEDMVQAVTDVQDLGVRVTIMHIAVDGNWTIPRTLRQECDSLVEIGAAQLRPLVSLLTGVDSRPAQSDVSPTPSPLSNGHGRSRRGTHAAHQPLQTGPHSSPPAMYNPAPTGPQPLSAPVEMPQMQQMQPVTERRGPSQMQAPGSPPIGPGPNPPSGPPGGPGGGSGQTGPGPGPGGPGGHGAPIGPSGPLGDDQTTISGPSYPMQQAAPTPYTGPHMQMPQPPPQQQPGPQEAGGSLSEAVQAAHREGREFGDSVARDAPALWLEAVLARKPRMPSDLEARLLQGSSLPIDFLLHDEVRHALRRGFWDALEHSRR